MKRGDLVTVSLGGDYGKPRPAVIVQNDAVAAFDSVILCPLSSARTDATTVRVVVEPDAENQLRARSEVMVEKVITAPRSRLGPVIGRLSAEAMAEVSQKLGFVLGIVG